MPGARPSTPDARPFAYAVGAVVLLGLVLRLIQLGTDSLWVDEINVVSFVRSGHLLTHLRNQRGPFESPLHPVAVWMALHLPFDLETAARVPAALFGALEVFGLVMFTRRVTGRREVAILAGLLLAVAPFAVRYSQEVRYYTTFSALHVVTFWLLVRALQVRERRAYVWWGVAVGAMLLAHPFAPVVVVAQLGVAFVVVRRNRRRAGGRGGEARDVGVGVLVAAVVAAPWYLWGAVRWIPDIVHGHSYALNTDSFPHVRLEPDLYGRIAQWLLGNGGRWSLLSALLVLLALAAPVLARDSLRRIALGVLAYVVLFVALLVPLAWALHTYLAVRRIEFLVPPLVLLAAIGIHAGAGRVAELAARHGWARVRAGGIVVATMVVVVGLSLVAVLLYYPTQKTEYRALAEVLRTVPKQDDVVVGPVDRRWRRPLTEYLGWRGVHRRLRFIAGGPLPQLTPTAGRVVWVTGSDPGVPGLTTRPLNDIARMQVIAGDRSAPPSILPWFVSSSRPQTQAALDGQLAAVSRIPALLSPPASSFPRWLFDGR
jgi:4-amino-4-deoxy-L-arabinose transferase-like glycosyltransferase